MEPEPERQDELSDQEWEIRTGRAIYILQQTLPDFFATGLVSNLDTSVTSSSSQEENASEKESIYSPKIRLSYTPPTPLPSPFPRTLHVEGLPLYMASSAFVRHTLNALYTDLRVELRRVRVHGPRSSPSMSRYSTVAANSSPVDASRSGFRSTPWPRFGTGGSHTSTSEYERKESLRWVSSFGQCKGKWYRGRLGSVRSFPLDHRGFDVKLFAVSPRNSTYTFSPITGLIYLHTIDSIYPAPHQAVYDALRAALVKLGLTGGQQGGEGVARNSTGKV
ncbi:hypothetical protein A0H81_01782 [Grifola frondosa]|uniref:Uncharacterized protein n=1 Tax=Grifola frondosa TaxID=5627 RepID=A0A1C7MLH3_GRIFR|nr:hypothetical protein A0H81_01782 [Grifola frondosa]